LGRARYQRAAGCAAARPGTRNGYCDSTIEESIAMGCRGFVVCGGAGVLRPNVALGHLIVVESGRCQAG
jgi:uridine phosphorylase